MKDKALSLKIANPQITLKNPLNNSVSKQQFSFSKAKRFENTKQPINHTFYDLPPTKNRRAASIGVCNRNTFLIHNVNPPPNKYDVKTPSNDRNIFFPVGRENALVDSFIKINANPGPGSYNPEMKGKVSSSKYSIRKKVGQIKKDQEFYPGPGKYDIKSELLNENKVLSTHTKHYCPVIFKRSQIRIKTQVDPIYPMIRNPEVNYKGQKTFQKEKGFSIGRERRFPDRTKTEGPGPGNYQQFSQFLH